MNRTTEMMDQSTQRRAGEPIAEMTKAAHRFAGIVFVIIVAITIVTAIAPLLPWSHRLLTLRVVSTAAVMMGALVVALWHWRRSQDSSALLFDVVGHLPHPDSTKFQTTAVYERSKAERQRLLFHRSTK
jgi:uncharacterized membrane protein